MRGDSKPFDATTKALLETDPAGWLEYAGLGRPAHVRIIDADLATITRAADKVIWVEDAPPWLAQVELQASYDAALPDRMLQYSVLLRGRHSLPVQSVAVLLRPEADGPAMTGHLRHHYPDGQCYLQFQYRVVRAWRQPVEAILTAGLGTLPLAPLSDVRPEALPDVIRRMEQRLRTEATPAEAGVLWTAAFSLMGLRYPPEFTAQLLQGVLDMEESSTYQLILQRGWAKGVAEGKAKGMAEGRVEGRAEGKVAEAIRLLLLQGTQRFGPADARVQASLAAIQDLERIERLALRLLAVESWDELLADA